MTRLLVVTAVPAERDAILASRKPAVGMLEGLEVQRSITSAGLVDVLVSGIGSVAAAVATSCALRQPYDLVLSAGIAGGFAPTTAGQVVVADAVLQADLGAESSDGSFVSMTELGWGPVGFELDNVLSTELAERCQGRIGTILTVSTTTGTQARAEALKRANPSAIAEAMEGIGVYAAAKRVGVSFGEIRAISNVVGPRDRAGWQLSTALGALSVAFDQLLERPIQACGRGTVLPSTVSR